MTTKFVSETLKSQGLLGSLSLEDHWDQSSYRFLCCLLSCYSSSLSCHIPKPGLKWDLGPEGHEFQAKHHSEDVSASLPKLMQGSK